MSDTIQAKRCTFSDTRNGYEFDEMSSVKYVATRPSTDVASSDVFPATTGKYVSSVVDGWQALVNLRQQQRTFDELTVDDDFEFDVPVAERLRNELFCVAPTSLEWRDTNRKAIEAIQIRLSRSVSTATQGMILEPELPEDETEIDWDMRIENPPPRESKTVMVMFEEGVYRTARIVSDPED